MNSFLFFPKNQYQQKNRNGYSPAYGCYKSPRKTEQTTKEIWKNTLRNNFISNGISLDSSDSDDISVKYTRKAQKRSERNVIPFSTRNKQQMQQQRPKFGGIFSSKIKESPKRQKYTHESKIRQIVPIIAENNEPERRRKSYFANIDDLSDSSYSYEGSDEEFEEEEVEIKRSRYSYLAEPLYTSSSYDSSFEDSTSETLEELIHDNQTESENKAEKEDESDISESFEAESEHKSVLSSESKNSSNTSSTKDETSQKTDEYQSSDNSSCSDKDESNNKAAARNIEEDSNHSELNDSDKSFNTEIEGDELLKNSGGLSNTEIECISSDEITEDPMIDSIAAKIKNIDWTKLGIKPKE